MIVDPDFNLEQLLVQKQWLAGKTGMNIDDQSLIKNPWVFNENGTFMTMKDKHHGTWTIENNNLIKLKWESFNGYADY